MNFRQLILDGVLDTNTKPFLANYFYRKAKEAKTVNYGTIEFFTKCKNSIQELEGEFIGQLNEVLVRMEDQLAMCIKKGSKKAAKRIQEQHDFITEDNFYMRLQGRSISKYDINLVKRGLTDAIELTKGDLSNDIEKVETIRKTRVKLSNTDDPFLLVPDQLKRGIIEMYEKNLDKEKKREPSVGLHKKEFCAAFCNYLYENNFFQKKTLAFPVAFAFERYGVNIHSAIDKLRRASNKKLLEDKTSKIMRIATGNKYGKLPNRIRKK